MKCEIDLPNPIRKPAGISTVFLFALLSSITGCSQTSTDPFAGARSRIIELMNSKNIASFQAAVAKDGKIVYEEAFGMANVERKIRTTPETMHLVASITKPFTSTALMILTERGKINLHRPINDYLGDSKLIAYQGNASDATVARMMLHTTGLPYGYYICGDEISLDKHRTQKEILNLSGVLVAAPGTRYQYTNIGYGILEDMVHQVTGVKLKTFIQNEIIVPLNLKHTRFFDSIPPEEMIATQNTNTGVLPIALDSDGYTALYSTAGDLVRFGMFHLKSHLEDQKSILADSSLDMLWLYNEPEVECTTRRLGWDVQQDWGFETIQHGGGGPGIHNWLYMIPSQNVVIAIMSNAMYSNSGSDPVLRELIAAALSKSGSSQFRPSAGRGYARMTRISPASFRGLWNGFIKGPKGACPVAIEFDDQGRPKLHIERDEHSGERWIPPSGEVSKGHKALLWRFDASIPYLYQYAIHDEVIIFVWQKEDKLIGSASAAKERNFGKGENYVLPQYIELTRAKRE